MKNVVFALLFPLLFVACVRKTPTTTLRKKPSQIRITSLKADNLSEELTGNDEIHLIIWLLKDSISGRLVLKEWQDTLTFHKSGLSLAKTLQALFPVDSMNMEGTHLLLLLMESDTDRLPEERAAKARNVLELTGYRWTDSLRSKMRDAILDDDLLGLSFYSFSTLEKNTGETIFFSVTNLF
jgi:hypothetical protein